MTIRFKDRLDGMAAIVHAARMAQRDEWIAQRFGPEVTLQPRVSPLAERIARQRPAEVTTARFLAMQGHRQLIRSRLRPETG